MNQENELTIDSILIGDRVRGQMGDIDELCNSIREFGIIQPLVLASDTSSQPTLVAGGRRLMALKRLGFKTLRHGKEFIWRDEVRSEEPAVRLKLEGIELEENLKRKDLTWPEQIRAKAKLLAIMQQIHGPARHGGLTREELRTGKTEGFGVRKLASMLNENQATVSKDLELAKFIDKVPHLATMPTKESAYRNIGIVSTIVEMKKATAKVGSLITDAKGWLIYEGRFQENIIKVGDDCVDLVYSDLPFGVDLSKMSHHSTGVASYADSRQYILAVLPMIMVETYRVLRENRYAIFWFGFNYYQEICEAIAMAKLHFSPVPIVWYKHTRSTEDPNRRYGNAYDPALLVWKGSPLMIRPGQANVVDIPAISPNQKLQIAQQPIELVEKFILDLTAEGSTILDFTAGSGTTGAAALKLKRKVILFESDKQTYQIAKARMEAAEKGIFQWT